MSSNAVDLRLVNLRFVVQEMAKFTMDLDLDTGQGAEHSMTTAGSATFSTGPTGQVGDCLLLNDLRREHGRTTAELVVWSVMRA